MQLYVPVPGEYRLTETKTAEGYTLLAEPIEFTLKADGQCLRDGAAFGAKTTDADGVCNIALTIYNRKGALPCRTRARTHPACGC